MNQTGKAGPTEREVELLAHARWGWSLRRRPALHGAALLLEVQSWYVRSLAHSDGAMHDRAELLAVADELDSMVSDLNQRLVTAAAALVDAGEFNAAVRNAAAAMHP